MIGSKTAPARGCGFNMAGFSSCSAMGRVLALSSLPCLLLSLSAKANAQDTDAIAVGDIVVTATKRAENLMDIPVAISAYTGETLTTVGIVDAQSLSIANPSIVYNNTGALAQPYIRGVGSRLLQNGLDPSVATYVDNRYIARQTAIVLDFFDVERVEVLKGPQGVLFGRNASAGAIRIITNDVSDEFEGHIRAGYGNYNQWKLDGAVNIPLGDMAGLRVSGMTSHRDGFVTNLIEDGRHEWDDKKFSAIRGKLRLEPSDSFEANLTLSYWTQDDNSGNETNVVGPLDWHVGIANGGITGVDSRHVATMVDGTNDKEELAADLGLKFDLGAITLQSFTTYSDTDNTLTFDGDGSSFPAVDAIIFEDAKVFSQELQLSSNSSGPLEWILGGYYYHEDTDYVITIFGAGINQGLQNVRTESWAAFGQLKYDITDNFSITAGGRYTHDNKKVDLRTSDKLGTSTAPAIAARTPLSNDLSWKKFTPTVTLEYKADDTLVYAKFARGYKSGGVVYPYAVGTEVDPEVLDMYEVGLKSAFADRKARLTLSGYYYDYKDLQVTRAAAGVLPPVVVTQNASNAELYGIDADLTWNVTPAFTLTGSFSWQHSEYKGYDDATAKIYQRVLNPAAAAGMIDVLFPNANGHQLLRAPEFSAFVSATYGIPVGDGTMPLTVSFAHKGSYDFDFVYDPPGALESGTTSVLHQKSYNLVNARLAYVPAGERWEVAIWGNNLFKEDYFDDVVGAGVGLRASYGAPRTYGIEARFNF